MKKIASFTVNHDILQKGLYTSRIDGDVTTYDVRMVRPNHPPFLETAAMHTLEHLFATYVRNSRFASEVIYVGPMGCRTGFYFLCRSIAPADVIALLQETFGFIAGFAGEIPGAAASECGNYLEHDLEGAKAIARDMTGVLKSWTVPMLSYSYFAS